MKVFIFGIAILWGICSWAEGSSVQSSLAKLIKVYQNERNKIESQLSEAVAEMAKSPLFLKDENNVFIQLEKQQNFIEALRSKLPENQAKLDVLHNLHDKLDNCSNFKECAKDIVLNLAQIEAHNLTSANGLENATWLFYVYLSIVVNEVMENGEDPFEFLTSYFQYTSVLDPKSPVGFAKSRTYLGEKSNIETLKQDSQIN